MEKAKEGVAEIEESSDGALERQPLLSTPNPNTSPKLSPTKSVKTMVPEIEVHLFRCGRGPIDVFRSKLGGWDRDQLEVREILDKYGFKSVYAFNRDSTRGAPIRFNQKNGRSMLSYSDGSVIYIDGEPKDSVVKPITKILVGVAVITLLIALGMKQTPGWIKKLNPQGLNFPPWILACMVIVFTRMRKRTGNLLRRFGW